MIGCAAQPTIPTPVAAVPSGRASSALAFDPPMTQTQGFPDLSRDQRGQAALVGFEEPATSSYDVFTYNRQSSDGSDYYDKEAVSERTGATHR